MSKSKAISNEEIIAALLECGTIKDAAAVVGLSVRAVYDRMQGQEFRKEYAEARADVLRSAVHSINDKLCAAVDVIGEIMLDVDTNPAVRLQAAQTIINNAGKFSERLSDEETKVANIGKNPFDLDLFA